MIYGFTGTQKGMSIKQLEGLFQLLTIAEEIHLGDCLGADEEARHMAAKMGVRTIGHPPSTRAKRAFGKFDETYPELPYLDRDMEIVDLCSTLIVAPLRELHPKCRHGTCWTWRYAIEVQRDIVVIPRA